MLRLIMMLPFLIVLVAFVLMNQTPSSMELPSLSWQSSAGAIALISAGVFFVLGALLVWFSELGQRRRARRAEQQVKQLEAKLADLHAQMSQAVAQHSTTYATTPAAIPASSPYLAP
ncbi:lipopolysaccharide assembly protein LapA domain-containing protein [Acetobacteraceae bacterium KSS8]|uniref:Lipopolysaccharide assembly protein LapA domain-containing protein n=1 Tax=Endosaccharibacter trunci TaxID=2812733 RepID=A0ABT1W5A8_9PROT|nr:lipopolysaccharide assembly protein LapA domain-containing protein [Acetobacteraceae bacterium KSS8]